jgi:hypothetical protein
VNSDQKKSPTFVGRARGCKAISYGLRDQAKRGDRPYRSGRSPDWIKVKNPNRPGCDQNDEAARFHRGSWRCGGVASSGARANLPVLPRFLNGAQARDLPTEQPIKFELLPISKTAKALGLAWFQASTATITIAVTGCSIEATLTYARIDN